MWSPTLEVSRAMGGMGGLDKQVDETGPLSVEEQALDRGARVQDPVPRIGSTRSRRLTMGKSEGGPRGPGTHKINQSINQSVSK